MGHGLDYTKCESLDRSDQELTPAERERLEKLLCEAKTNRQWSARYR